VGVDVLDDPGALLDLVGRYVVGGVLLGSGVEHLDGVAVGSGVAERCPREGKGIKVALCLLEFTDGRTRRGRGRVAVGRLVGRLDVKGVARDTPSVSLNGRRVRERCRFY
jgi:hypothetical protein